MPSEVVIRLVAMTPWQRAKTGVRALFTRKQIAVLVVVGSFAPVLAVATWAIGATPASWIALALIPGVAIVLFSIALRALATGLRRSPRGTLTFREHGIREEKDGVITEHPPEWLADVVRDDEHLTLHLGGMGAVRLIVLRRTSPEALALESFLREAKPFDSKATRD